MSISRLLVLMVALQAAIACSRGHKATGSNTTSSQHPQAQASNGTSGANSRDAQTDDPNATASAARTGLPSANAARRGEVPPMPDWSQAALSERTPRTDGPRYYVKTRHVWIYPEPNLALQWIGFLWTGGSVRLKHTRPVYGPVGCSFFYAVDPVGFICSDGNRGTLDPNDRIYRQLLRYAPRTDSPWLHRYGQVSTLTRYFAFPGVPKPTGAHADAGAENAFGFDFYGISPSVHEAHVSLIDRSTVAFSAEASQNGKDWLLTSDYALIEKSKVKPYPVVEFQGVHLSEGNALPLAFFKGEPRPRYIQDKPDHFEINGQPFERLSWVGLTGKHKHAQDADWLETKTGAWVRASDATVPTPMAQTPWGATVGSPDTSTTKPKGRATWIEVSIVGGWMIAYEGTTPVFTTLISPGSGGMPKKGQMPIDTFSTPLGRFQINGKFISSTMTGPTGLIHSEVPYAQNFADLYAIHTAYWHDNWGYPMSGGCVNASPIDGYFLFHWTEPPFREDWYGVRWLPSQGPSTTVIIHR